MLALLASTHPWPVLAQDVLNCSVTGFCLSSSINSLLGLPNGTLNIVGYQPWDTVVKGSAAVSWAPLEADARAAISTLHGVPNDNRLAYAALEEIRGFMFLRLLQLAQRRARGDQLSSVEQDALETLHGLVKGRRVRAAQKALDEYHRWHDDPCHYIVPAGFSFEAYNPGAGCGIGITILTGPPSPPTAQQFTQYGAALATKEADDALTTAKRKALGIADSNNTFTYDPSADQAAAIKSGDRGLAFAEGVALAVAASGAAAIAAVASVGVAGVFATLSGSYSAFGIAAAAAGAAVTGVGVALALPAIIILCVVVSVLRGIQVVDDQSVPTTLQEQLDAAYATQDPWTIAQTDLGQIELFAAFIYQTLPNYDEQREASLVPPPSQPQRGDPLFEVDNALVPTIQTQSPEAKVQETFMSQGWFVTRTETSSGTWGPRRWSLTLDYIAGANDPGKHTVGIQPSGFLHFYRSPTFASNPVAKATQFDALNASSSVKTIKWSGNRAPVITATVSEYPRMAQSVQFNANVSDPDGNTIKTIRWYFDEGIANTLVYQTSLAECSLRPAGRVDSNGLPYLCPWAQADGASVSHVYNSGGTYSVLVMAEDSEGAISSELFSVTVGFLAPTLTMTQLPFTVLPGGTASTPEGQQVNVAGTVNFPANPDGNYSDLTRLVVDWGDGGVLQKMYPCKAGSDPGVVADASCIFDTTNREYVELNVVPVPGSPDLAHGPWPFFFSHKYAFSPDHPLDPIPSGITHGAYDAQSRIKVYAVTTRGIWSQVERVNFTISNVPPALDLRPVCPVVPVAAPTCVGDFREVADGQALTLNARIFDVLEANHFIKVLWGDGTSSELQAGCTASGCPSYNAWPGAPLPTFGAFPKYFKLSHTYPKVGDYAMSIVVDDGGPGGKASASTGSVIFGVSQLDGPAETPAGIPVPYNYTSKLPAGATSVVTPTCEGGQVASQTASSFTCTFDDVATQTPRKAKLQAVIAGTTFNRSLDVKVQPAALTMSMLSGPTSVIGGMTRTYTYTSTHSTFATATYVANCAAGTVVAETPGSSFTCKFQDPPFAADISVTVNAQDSLEHTAVAGLTVNLAPDLSPPELTVPSAIQVNSTNNAGAKVSFAVSAVDNVSGVAPVSCNPASGSLFPIGTTTVTCQASDWKNLTAVGSFSIRVVDATPPLLTLPAAQELNATSPTGAIATFTATASDGVPLLPAVTCVPASGSTFAIGTTNVACSAKDAAGNLASGTFPITVIGAAGQIATLQSWVENVPIDATLQKQLVSVLKKAEAAAASGDSKTACKQLTTAVSLVNDAGNKLTKGQSNKILNDVARIRAVVGC